MKVHLGPSEVHWPKGRNLGMLPWEGREKKKRMKEKSHVHIEERDRGDRNIRII